MKKNYVIKDAAEFLLNLTSIEKTSSKSTHVPLINK